MVRGDDVAAATRIVRRDGARRGRGRDVDILWRRDTGARFRRYKAIEDDERKPYEDAARAEKERWKADCAAWTAMMAARRAVPKRRGAFSVERACS